jgi:hypothetical protein
MRFPCDGRAPRDPQARSPPFNRRFADCYGIETQRSTYGFEREDLCFVIIRDPLDSLSQLSACVRSAGADSVP